VTAVPATATAHIGLFGVALLLAFAVGVCGQILRSRALIVASIVAIAVISLYFVEVGEVASFNR
jgi:hypothetical protein